MALNDGRQMSHGRGGAGNIAPRSPALQPVDLETPTIKTKTYTTGRGGTGNMAANDPLNPALARQAQDVDLPIAVAKEPENQFRYGRGGAANVAQLSQEQVGTAKSKTDPRRKSAAEGVVGQFGKEERAGSRERDEKPRNVVEKGIGMLNKVMNKGS
ncbi:hypothetical protein MBLNU459_g8367t1 [Dothideomycetes sp. NU459]